MANPPLSSTMDSTSAGASGSMDFGSNSALVKEMKHSAASSFVLTCFSFHQVENTPQPLITFPRFRDLPSELRLSIWKMALETEAMSRVVIYHPRNNRYELQVVPSKNLVSPIMMATVESRECGLGWFDIRAQVVYYDCPDSWHRFEADSGQLLAHDDEHCTPRPLGFVYLRTDSHIFMSDNCLSLFPSGSFLWRLLLRYFRTAMHAAGVLDRCSAALSFRHQMLVRRALVVDWQLYPDPWQLLLTELPGRQELYALHIEGPVYEKFPTLFLDISRYGMLEIERHYGIQLKRARDGSGPYTDKRALPLGSLACV